MWNQFCVTGASEHVVRRSVRHGTSRDSSDSGAPEWSEFLKTPTWTKLNLCSSRASTTCTGRKTDPNRSCWTTVRVDSLPKHFFTTAVNPLADFFPLFHLPFPSFRTDFYISSQDLPRLLRSFPQIQISKYFRPTCPSFLGPVFIWIVIFSFFFFQSHTVPHRRSIKNDTHTTNLNIFTSRPNQKCVISRSNPQIPR